MVLVLRFFLLEVLLNITCYISSAPNRGLLQSSKRNLSHNFLR